MIEIDGSCGEGGGQILRSSLSLSALTGREMRVTNIRAKRRKPGLMRQHLTCVKAVAEISGGSTCGAEISSQELVFSPGKLRAGDYRFAVGSAGSAVLIAQTVLPLLLHAEAASRVVIEGGPPAANAPVFDYFERVYLPCLRRMGAEVTAVLDRVGFYPAGGGKIELSVIPVREWKPLVIDETGVPKAARLVSISHGIDAKIRDDELAFCLAALDRPDGFETESREVDSPGPGNVMFAELEFEHVTELFSVCGDFDLSRKAVGERVAGMVNRYRALSAPVWRFLADQLLLPMAIGAGGAYLTCPPGRHTQTNIEVIRKFLEIGITVENRQNGQYRIEVKQ